MSNVPLLHYNPPTSSNDNICIAIGCPTEDPYTTTCLWSSKILQALSRLPHITSQALKTAHPSYSPACMRGRERGGGDVEVTTLMCRMIKLITTLAGPGFPTSIQSADKNKAGCNSIQTINKLGFIHQYVHSKASNQSPSREWTCSHVQNGMLQYAINNSPPSFRFKLSSNSAYYATESWLWQPTKFNKIIQSIKYYINHKII